jgi:hypothetical protein
MRYYNFDIEIVSRGKGYVVANSLEEAQAKIKSNEWEDIYDEVDQKYGKILEITEAEEIED